MELHCIKAIVIFTYTLGHLLQTQKNDLSITYIRTLFSIPNPLVCQLTILGHFCQAQMLALPLYYIRTLIPNSNYWPVALLHQDTFQRSIRDLFWFVLFLNTPVNSCDHAEMVSSSNHTLCLGKHDEAVNQYFVHTLSLVTDNNPS